ncbi:MAG: hypothetical protein IJV00_02335 [Clostridia bacterium]|nr:hypothetical protein [Clostridia bacterium]
MKKNTTVIDNEGNVIGATYAKRANCLIRRGRARVVDENTICLECPANKSSEDMEMVNIYSAPAAENAEDDKKLSLRELLDDLNKMRESFLRSETEQIALIRPPQIGDGAEKTSPDETDPATLTEIYGAYYEKLASFKMSSQTTLQKLIGLYEKIIDRIEQN